MSALFTLDFSGPETPCDFPGCTLNSFHDGEHKPAEKTPVQWTYDRHCIVCGVPFTVLGADPKMIFATCGSQECLLHFARHNNPPVSLTCRCAQRPYPHELGVHTKLRSEKPGVYLDYYDFVVRFADKEMRWPWSLCLSGREEPSAERRQS